MEQIKHIDERVIIIKTHENKIIERGSLYEAIHKWWDLKKDRASRAMYIFAVIRERGEIVQEVYKIDSWYEEQDGDQLKPDIDLCFDGKEADEEVRLKYVGKYLPHEYWMLPGVIASCLYTYQ